jgi:hypothetical protein
MENSFSLARVASLTKRRMNHHRHGLAINTLAMLGISIMLIGSNLQLTRYELQAIVQNDSLKIFESILGNIFNPFMAISMTIIASKMFVEYGKKDEGIASLMIPATHFEKWLVAFLTSTVYFLVIALGIFMLACVLNIAVFNAMWDPNIPFSAVFLIFKKSLFLPMLESCVFLHAIFFLGSITFKDGHWWSTALALMCLTALYGGINFMLPELIYPSNVNLEDRAGIKYAIIDKKDIFSIPIAAGWAQVREVIFWISVPLFWFLSYLKLTEKQI